MSYFFLKKNIIKTLNYLNSKKGDLNKKIRILKYISKKKYIIKFIYIIKKYFTKKNKKKHFSITISGTGGDMKNTFNISTISYIFLNLFNYNIYKFGSQSYSSKSGSIDFLKIINNKCKIVNLKILDSKKIFINLKNLTKIRKFFKKITIFNYCFPFVNPILSKYNIIGSSNIYIHDLFKDLIITGLDGVDEFSIFNRNKISFYKNNYLTDYIINYKDISIKNKYESFIIFYNIIKNNKNYKVYKKVIVMNIFIVIKFLSKSKKNFIFFLNNFFKFSCLLIKYWKIKK
ncbi:hypothetical protein [Candidatus Vidania fulgoroideorum]